MDYIEALEDSLGVTASKNFLPMQPGDVEKTFSDTNSKDLINFVPRTPVRVGINEFVAWFKNYNSGLQFNDEPPRPQGLLCCQLV